jgi:cyclopropane fatty-acyl-phospholipid synthase-like methyltransferase
MDWIHDFYARQDALVGVYSGPSRDHHRDKVAIIARLTGRQAPLRILELGAGGGQCAAAAAGLGHHVVAIELVEAATENARRLAADAGPGSVEVIRGDFYAVDPGGPFDRVVYWDGFGVGDDADQRRLLTRIAGWIAPGGRALIDVYTPWYAAASAGRRMRFGDAWREYDFNPVDCQWLDRWWPDGREGESVTQALRAYSPADLSLLLQGTGLALECFEAGGGVDWETGRWIPSANLGQSMSFTACLKLV